MLKCFLVLYEMSHKVTMSYNVEEGRDANENWTQVTGISTLSLRVFTTDKLVHCTIVFRLLISLTVTS